MPVPAVTPAPCPQETRLKEGIVKLKPHEEPLRSELLSGKFTILVRWGCCVLCVCVSCPELPQAGGSSWLRSSRASWGAVGA